MGNVFQSGERLFDVEAAFDGIMLRPRWVGDGLALGDGFLLDAGEALDLVDELRAAVANFRRGRMIDDFFGWCVVCGVAVVNAGDGFDTCPECLGAL